MTLTEAASFTKKAFVFIFIFFIILIISVFGVRAYLAAEKAKVKPPEEKADLNYGVLPKPNLEKSLGDSSSYNYTLNTEDGKLPTQFPKLIKVYFIPKLGTTLLAGDRAKSLAREFKFEQGPNIISPTKYQFTDGIGGEITIDLDTSNFKYSREASLSAEETSEVIADQPTISLQFRDFLKRHGLLKEQLTEGGTNIEYETGDQSTSNTAVVTLWQNNIDELPIITSNFKEGLVRTIINKSINEDSRYDLLDYNYWEIDTTNFATYPLKDIQVAFDEMKKGESSVVIEPTSPNISIVKAYLGYLLSKQYTPYLQPVYVFEGENKSFAALVPAITQENLEK